MEDKLLWKLRFVNICGPDDATALSIKRIIRSQAARSNHRRVQTSKPKRRSRAKQQTLWLTYDLPETSPLIEDDPDRVEPGWCIAPMLGGLRTDPFFSYPVQWRPNLPFMVDHYLTELAVDIPELDQPHRSGLLRTQWFPLVMTDAAPFLVILLLAASHHASVQPGRWSRSELLRLKQESLASINSILCKDDPSEALSDQVIGAVAKMASFEAMYGDLNVYEMHMSGLKEMVALRGGLDCLGLQGLLRRIVLWIDSNSTYLNNTIRWFEESIGFAEPNPSQFIGVP